MRYRYGFAGLMALLAFMALVGAAAAPQESEDPMTHRVAVSDFEFLDNATNGPVTIARVGDVVEFVLVDGMHTATGGVLGVPIEGYGPESPLMTHPGETYVFPVTEPGTIAYTCIIHPDMEAFIIARRNSS